MCLSFDYIDSRQRLNELPLPDKKKLYSNLNMEDITVADYKHVKRVWEDFEIQKVWVSIMICTFKAIYYYRQMYLKPFAASALRRMNLILLISYQHQDWHAQEILK